VRQAFRGTGKSFGNDFLRRLVVLLIVVLLPAGVIAAQAHASMQVSVQVVRGYSSAGRVAALTSRIERIAAARTRGLASGNGDTDCTAIGQIVMLDGAWARCSWEPGTDVYWITVQY
jgi:hypothetical protein